MTLVLAMANEEYAVVVSDRRLTSNEQPPEDESNKAAYVVCDDARVAVAFTGLAELGPFATRRWMLDTLSEAAPPDHLVGPMLKRFADLATRDINPIHTDRPEDKRLTFAIIGFHYAEDPPRPFCCVVSNFEEVYPQVSEQPVPGPEFKGTFWCANRPAEEHPSYVLALGAPSGVEPDALEALRDILCDRRPPEAAVGKAVEIVQLASDSLDSGGLVGKQCSSIVVPSDPARPVQTGYHSGTAARKTYQPSYVDARGGGVGGLIVRDAEMAILDQRGNPTVIAVPKVGRNRPCPCGSGRKYKKCHGGPRRKGGGLEVGFGGP